MSSAAYPIWSRAFYLIYLLMLWIDLPSSVTVKIPAEANLEYKYIRKLNGGITWLSDPNNALSVGATGNMTVDDVWR